MARKKTTKTYEDGQREMRQRCFQALCINLRGEDCSYSTQQNQAVSAKNRAIAQLEIYPNA